MEINIDQFIEDYYAAWNAHDLDRLASFYAEDGVHEDFAVGSSFRGKIEIMKGISPLFLAFPDFNQELKSVFRDADWFAHEWIMSGTQTRALNVLNIPATGKYFSVRGASITQLRNGKISRNTDYWNLSTMLQQLGVMSVLSPQTEL